MNLATVVQHHPRRADLLPRLLALLNDPRVVTDPDPTGARDPWRCYQACLTAVPEDATHALIVQDDCLPCVGFHPRVEQAIRERPDSIICLFVSQALPVRAAVLRAVKAGEPWALLNKQAFVPVVATVYPARHVRAIRAWAETLDPKKHRRSDDFMVSQYARAKRVDVWATVPSLADHDGSVPSLIGAKPAKHREVAALA